MELKWKGKYSKNKKPNPATKKIGKNGLPKPLEAKCFQCKKKFLINYVVFSKGYGKKNNWEYWTNPKSWDPDFWKDKEARKKDKKICGTCLSELFYDKERFWETIKDPRRRNKLRGYVYTGIIE